MLCDRSVGELSGLTEPVECNYELKSIKNKIKSCVYVVNLNLKLIVMYGLHMLFYHLCLGTLRNTKAILCGLMVMVIVVIIWLLYK